jgi:hypothetical protein
MTTPRAIVPLFEPDRSELYDPNHPAHVAASAHLTYRGGPLLGRVRIVPVFWGDAWRTGHAQIDEAHWMAGFYAELVTGPTLQRLAAEYSVPNFPISAGTVEASVYVPRKSTRAVSDNQIRRRIEKGTLAGRLPDWSPDMLVVVHLQPGMAVTQGGSRSCQAFCGYHDSLSNDGGPDPRAYAVLPYPSCTGCLGGLSAFDSLTSIASHEVMEAVSDPIPGSGWYDGPSNAENADLCAWIQGSEAGYVVQKMWSNAAQACV